MLSTCIRCWNKFEPYSYSGIMITLCKDCRYPLGYKGIEGVVVPLPKVIPKDRIPKDSKNA